MICPACAHPRLDDAQRFCGYCGRPFSSAAQPPAVEVPPAVEASRAAEAPPAVAGAPAGVARATPHGARYGTVTPLPQRAGLACPICFSTVYANRYTFWHGIVALLTFPIGALFLFVPIHVCDRGHRFGPGLFVVGVIKMFLAVVAVVIGLGAWLFLDSIRQIAHAL